VQRAGIAVMFSDVDVRNTPKIDAMGRTGHMADQTAWHVWVYRAAAADITGPSGEFSSQ
jgi:hypothetical protein